MREGVTFCVQAKAKAAARHCHFAARQQPSVSKCQRKKCEDCFGPRLLRSATSNDFTVVEYRSLLFTMLYSTSSFCI